MSVTNRHQVIHIVIWLWNWSVCDKTSLWYSHCQCELEVFVTKQYQLELSVCVRSVCDKTISGYSPCQCEKEAFVTKQDQVICTVSVRQKRLWQNRIKLFVLSVWDRSICDKTGSSYLHCQCETEVSVTIKPASSYSRCQCETSMRLFTLPLSVWDRSVCSVTVYVVWQLI